MTISHRTRALQAVHFHSDKFQGTEYADLQEQLNHDGGKGGYAWFKESRNYKIFVWVETPDCVVIITVIRYHEVACNSGDVRNATVINYEYDWSR